MTTTQLTSDQRAGEPKYSPTAADPLPPSGATGSGDAAQAGTGAPSMAVNSPTSPAAKRGRRSTGSAASLTDRLQIAQQAILDLMTVGVDVKIMADGPDVLITLHQVAVIDGDLVILATP